MAEFVFLPVLASLFFLLLSFSLPKDRRQGVRTRSLFCVVASLGTLPLGGFLSAAAQGTVSAVLLLLLFFSIWKASLPAKH